MGLTSKQVQHIASLANLPITQQEEKRYIRELSRILDYVGQLSKVETENVEPFAHATDASNVTREDKASLGLTTQEALANCKNTHNNLLKVPAILQNE